MMLHNTNDDKYIIDDENCIYITNDDKYIIDDENYIYNIEKYLYDSVINKNHLYDNL